MPDLHSLDGEQVEGVPPELALYPFGAFTTFVVADGRVLGWSQHLMRLVSGAMTLWSHQVDEGRVTRAVAAHLALLRSPSAVRVTLFPAVLDLARPAEMRGCTVLVSSRPCEFPFAAQPDLSVTRVEHARALPEVKSTDLFSQIGFRRRAQLGGYDDALFCRGDQVLEGPTWSVLVWHAGEVSTPQTAVLQSITADHVGRIAQSWGRRFSRRPVRLTELARADLVLAVNARTPARAIGEVDGEPLRLDRALLERVASAYSALPRDRVG